MNPDVKFSELIVSNISVLSGIDRLEGVNFEEHEEVSIELIVSLNPTNSSNL